MIVYKVRKCDLDIREVDVLRMTDKSVYLQRLGKEFREARYTTFADYYETREEAVARAKNLLAYHIAQHLAAWTKYKAKLAEYEAEGKPA
jgi:hypothetical protein